VKLVRVEWLDHCEAEGNVWMSVADAADAELARCESVGWLVHLDARRLVLTTSRVTDEDTVARPFVLAVSAVVKVTELEG
jgi:hypothetical protein